MELYEVPLFNLYNGEAIIPLRFQGDPYSEQQWLFERAYTNSRFARGVPFREGFFRGSGLEQYQFYRVEIEPPGWFEFRDAGGWWNMEKHHWHNDGIIGERSPFILYFREWMFCRAMSHCGYFDPWSNDTFPWLDSYLEFAPS